MVVIQALEKLERYWGITKRYPGFAPGIDTINPAYIEGGLHPAYIPSEAKLWITVHFYPNENVDDITQEIEKQVIAAAKADPWLRDNLPTFQMGWRFSFGLIKVRYSLRLSWIPIIRE